MGPRPITPRRRHLAAAAAVALGLGLGLGPAPARADVTGTITLTGSAGKPPARGKAFLDRVENPLVGARPLDPMPHLVVVLERTSGDPPAEMPPQVRWELLGDSFARPLLPVVAGTEVLIQNRGRRSPTLVVEGNDAMLPRTPLNPKTDRAFKAVDPGLLVVHDEDLPHLVGRVLVLPTPWFAIPDRNGKYAINAPDGSYTAKVWYRTGWLDGVEATVEVQRGKATLDFKLPPGLKTK